MVDYSYPDPGELVTLRMIEETTGNGDYWETSEALALEAARVAIVDVLGDTHDRAALDVGTGEGRLLPWLAGMAAEIGAQDPDRERLDEARRRWERHHQGGSRVRFATTLGELGLTQPASILLCSHVFQHITRTARRELFDALTAHAAPDAVLVTTFSQGSQPEQYRLEHVRGGELVVQSVDRSVFESHAAGSELDAPNALPIHYLVAEDVAGELERSGWRSVLRWSYHVTDGDRVPSLGDDILANVGAPEAAAAAGRDVLLVLRRSVDG